MIPIKIQETTTSSDSILVLCSVGNLICFLFGCITEYGLQGKVSQQAGGTKHQCKKEARYKEQLRKTA